MCYDIPAVIPSSRKEVGAIAYIVDFLLAVAASVVAYYICKWLDGE